MLAACRALLFAVLVTACSSPSPPKATPSKVDTRPTIAVTIDDLPWMGPAQSGAEGVGKIVSALATANAPATGFVTCSRIDEQQAAMKVWQSSHVPFGNHSTSHRSLNDMPVEDWLEDVAACSRRLSGETSFFRYPFLQHGRTIETKERAARALAELGYQVAHVSIDTSDWAFDHAYGKALERSDRDKARAIADAYVAHVSAAAQRYRRIASERLGRDVSHVLLLHANRINADALERVLASLSSAGFRFVPLKEALADPVYRMRDDYVGPIGMSWLYRIDHAQPDMWHWDEAQMESVEVRFGERAVRIREDMTVRRLASKVYLVVHEKPWAANMLLVEMDDGSLVLVSTPYTYEATKALIGWTRDAFGERRITAVSTHFHWDGAGGIGALREAGIAVHGSDLTVEALRTRGERMRSDTLGGAWEDHRMKAELERTKLEPPNLVFAAREGLSLIQGELVAVWPGAGHSPDNLVVWFPKRRVLFGGCLVKAGDSIGNLSDADLDAWPSSVRALRRFPAEWVIPGHGEPGDLSLLDNTLALVAAAK